MPSKKEKEAYGELLYQYKPTVRSFLISILKEKFYSLTRTKEAFYVDSATFVPKEDEIGKLPLKYLAVVSGSEVVEMIRLNEDTAKLMLSKKTKLVEFDPRTTIVKKGMSYTDNKFVEKHTIKNLEGTDENKKD